MTYAPLQNDAGSSSKELTLKERPVSYKCNGNEVQFMGLLSRLFSKKSPPSLREQELERQFLPIIMKDIATKEQAQLIFQKLLKEVKADIVSESDLPANMGDYFLKTEKSNPRIHKMLEKRRLFGVSDEEIRQWWNKDKLERGLIKKFSEFQRMAIYSMLKKQGMSAKEAGKEVKMCFPTYGEKDLSLHLPYEIKEKVDNYIYGLLSNPQISASTRQEIQAVGSVNAFVVEKLEQGLL
ncbi:hypothetical protein SDC9_03940 [bioreactor metagenome]|uniref:Uncharacterized protein n=1 Tax=bioreactor metagenome TaxID=1076179 RepID=A0A644SVV8_9ZZZZ|nr:hypothetical protein [Negativicutes bacterium]